MRVVATLLMGSLLAAPQSVVRRGVGIPAAGGGGSCATGFLHCRSLTLASSQSGSADTANFPLVTQNGATAMTLGSSRIQNASCYDVIFTTDQAGTTKLPWEIESCDQSTGAVIAWVGVPTLSHTSDTVVWVQYDNASISTAQNTGSYAPTAVWDSNYKLVQHYGTFSSTTVPDSTTNTNTGTIPGGLGVTQTTGATNGGATFSANNVTVPNAASLRPTHLTLEAWVYPTGTGAYLTIAGNHSPSAGDYVYSVALDSTGTHFRTVEWVSASNFNSVVDSATVTTNTWYHVAVTWDGTTLTLYKNGASVGTDTTFSGNLLTDEDQPFSTGAAFDGSAHGYWIGKIDEVRLSDDSRSAAYVLASYNNQKSSSTFLTVGAEF